MAAAKARVMLGTGVEGAGSGGGGVLKFFGDEAVAEGLFVLSGIDMAGNVACQ